MNIEEVNEFIERKLDGKKVARASELPIENEHEMILLFGAALFRSDKKAIYTMKVLDGKFQHFMCSMTDFIIEIK